MTLDPGDAPDRATASDRFAGRSRPQLFAAAARFRTLSLSQSPVLAAGWLAAERGTFRVDVTLAAMLGAGAIQLGTNLWNDAADAASGVDSPDRLGPPRMVALGLLDGAEVKRAALASFCLAAVAGLYLAAIGGWPVVAVGLVSLLLGYAYSMGPRPLSGLPFGELLVVLFFGLVAVSTTAWLQAVDPFAPRTAILGLTIGLPAAAVLMLNNHRDRAQDARAGRRTLAIVIGAPASRGSTSRPLRPRSAWPCCWPGVLARPPGGPGTLAFGRHAAPAGLGQAERSHRPNGAVPTRPAGRNRPRLTRSGRAGIQAWPGPWMRQSARVRALSRCCLARPRTRSHRHRLTTPGTATAEMYGDG